MNMYDDIYDQEPLTEEQEFGMTVSELIDKEVERWLEEKVDELRVLRDVNRSLGESLQKQRREYDQLQREVVAVEKKAYEQGREDERREFLGGLTVGDEVHFMKHTFVSQACKVCGGQKQLTVVHEQAGAMEVNCPACNLSGRQGDWYWKPYTGKIVQVDVKIRDKGSLSEGKFYIKADKYDSSFEVELKNVFKTKTECLITR
jgi:hypothetical protein